MQFLTDGIRFLGPYGADEPFAIHRGTRTLREVHGAHEVHVIVADTDLDARGIWQRQQAAARRARRTA
jgi:hypothetical protein